MGLMMNKMGLMMIIVTPSNSPSDRMAGTSHSRTPAQKNKQTNQIKTTLNDDKAGNFKKMKKMKRKFNDPLLIFFWFILCCLVIYKHLDFVFTKELLYS